MEYRIYFLEPPYSEMGHIPVLKDDDSAAIEAAKCIAVKRFFELWADQRLVFKSHLEPPRNRMAEKNRAGKADWNRIE